MIQSFQMAVVILMREIAQSVNASHFNLSDFSQRMQLAIENTVKAAEQVRQPLFSLGCKNQYIVSSELFACHLMCVTGYRCINAIILMIIIIQWIIFLW